MNESVTIGIFSGAQGLGLEFFRYQVLACFPHDSVGYPEVIFLIVSIPTPNTKIPQDSK